MYPNPDGQNPPEPDPQPWRLLSRPMDQLFFQNSQPENLFFMCPYIYRNPPIFPYTQIEIEDRENKIYFFLFHWYFLEYVRRTFDRFFG